MGVIWRASSYVRFVIWRASSYVCQIVHASHDEPTSIKSGVRESSTSWRRGANLMVPPPAFGQLAGGAARRTSDDAAVRCLGLMQASHSAVPRTTTTLGMPAVGGATGALVETPVGGGVRPPLEHPVGMPTSFLAPVLQGVPAAPAMQGLQLPLEHTSESAEADGGPRAVAAGRARWYKQDNIARDG